MRLQTMRDAIDWSYQLLTAHEQDIFVRLSVFSGGFTLAAAEAICDTTPDDGRPPAGISVFDAIESLVNKSLLRLETDDRDEPRYTMLETIREFGMEIIVRRGDETTVRNRHARYFCQLADQGSLHLKTSETAVWLPRLNASRDNLRATLEWLDRSDRVDDFLKCASWMATYWDYQGQINEGRLWIERALSKPDIGESSALASCLVWLGWFQLRQGELASAEASLLQTVPIWTRLGHVSGLAYAHSLLGTIARTRAEFASAREHYDEALRLFTSVNDLSGMAEALINRSKLDHATGDLRAALANAEAGLAIATDAQILTYTAVGNVTVAQARTATGDLVGALAAVRRGFEIAQSINFAVCCADATVCIAAIAAASGQRDLAVRLLGAAEAWLKRTGSAWFFFHHQFEKTRDQTRAAVGEQRFDRLLAEGALYSPEAVAETVASLAIESIAVRVESPHLTSREREVLILLAAGKSDREISDALFITYRTANAYVARVLTKLDVPSRTAAASRALREGLI
jgi:non-specific serine/threonine protein kinase